MPINVNIDCTNIIKTDLQTAFCVQILCHLKEILSKFSLIIVVSNDRKRKRNKENDYRYIEILILVLKNRKYA